jgi:hypothetical protein
MTIKKKDNKIWNTKNISPSLWKLLLGYGMNNSQDSFNDRKLKDRLNSTTVCMEQDFHTLEIKNFILV